VFENPLIRRSQLQRRDYQVGLAEAATKNNLLVVLPTALGKTEIAALAASPQIGWGVRLQAFHWICWLFQKSADRGSAGRSRQR